MSLCEFCPAACCQHINIPLTTDEAVYMGGNTTLKPLDMFEQAYQLPLKQIIAQRVGISVTSDPPRRFYYMRRCKFLASPDPEDPFGKQRCKIQGDKRRPKICGELKNGSSHCRAIRTNRGI